MSSHPEKILGVTRAALEAVCGPLADGFITGGRERADSILSLARFRVRDEVEGDPSFKQIIPYVVLRHRQPQESMDDLYFTYARGKAGGEARLVGKRSLGVGGHVEESDFDIDHRLGRWAGYTAALNRELSEEVCADYAGFPGSDFKPLIGFVNDESNAVGAVHFGFVHAARLRTPSVRSRDGHTLAWPGFVSLGLLPTLRDQYETWSQLLIDEFSRRASE